jgi:hypothetical protein
LDAGNKAVAFGMPSLLGGTDLHHRGQSKAMPALLEMFANSETVETPCTEDFLELKILSRILGRSFGPPWSFGSAREQYWESCPLQLK